MNSYRLQQISLTASVLSIIVLLSSFSLAFDRSEIHLDPDKLITKMEEALGGKDRFYSMKDVQFDYTFEYVEKGKKDISVEKMIFEGEHTWAKYTFHEALVMPDHDGDVIHAVINGQPYVQAGGKLVKEENALKSCLGIRKANYYWFTMMYKLSDPGIILTSLDHERIDKILYHKVKVEYDSQVVGKEDNDAYILYINSKTHLVDRFHFGIPEDKTTQGVKIEVKYDTVRGLKVPAKRSAFMPDENGNYPDTPRLIQASSNFQFKNNFKVEDLIPKEN